MIARLVARYPRTLLGALAWCLTLVLTLTVPVAGPFMFAVAAGLAGVAYLTLETVAHARHR